MYDNLLRGLFAKDGDPMFKVEHPLSAGQVMNHYPMLSEYELRKQRFVNMPCVFCPVVRSYPAPSEPGDE